MKAIWLHTPAVVVVLIEKRAYTGDHAFNHLRWPYHKGIVLPVPSSLDISCHHMYTLGNDNIFNIDKITATWNYWISLLYSLILKDRMKEIWRSECWILKKKRIMPIDVHLLLTLSEFLLSIAHFVLVKLIATSIRVKYYRLAFN